MLEVRFPFATKAMTFCNHFNNVAIYCFDMILGQYLNLNFYLFILFFIILLLLLLIEELVACSEKLLFGKLFHFEESVLRLTQKSLI